MSVMIMNSSITHTVGNVIMTVTDYLRNHHFKNADGTEFFKTVHVNSRLAYKQLDIFRTKKEFFKREKPMLIIRPRLELNDQESQFYGSTIANRPNNSFESNLEFIDIIPLITDYSGGVSLWFAWDRLAITFDVVYVVGTYNEQVNLEYYIRKQYGEDNYFMINTPLEAYIPNPIINEISKFKGIPRENKPDLVQYINTHSHVPFTYKLKNGSGNNEFFALYNTNINSVVNDISRDDGESKGMIVDTFTVAFQITCRFYCMSYFQLALNDNINKMDTIAPDLGKDDNKLVPLYSIPLSYDLNLEKGWIIYESPTYNVGNGVEIDETDLTPLFNDSFKLVIKYKDQMGLPLDLFFKFRVFKGQIEIPYGKDGFMIDFENQKLYTYDCNWKETYRLFILSNNLYINSITTEQFEFNKEK